MTERRKSNNGPEAAKLLGGLDLKTLVLVLIFGGGSGLGAKFGLDNLLPASQISQDQVEMLSTKIIEGINTDIGELKTVVDEHLNDKEKHEGPDVKSARIRSIIDREITPTLNNIQRQLNRIEQDIREVRKK